MKPSIHRCIRFVLAFSACGLLTFSAHAQPVDFTEFIEETFPLTDGFPEAFWATTPTEAMIDENPFSGSPNASVNVLYGPDNALGKRFVGQLYPGPRDGRTADDDVIGFVLGFEPGDGELFSPDALEANYVLIDWKGITQTFDFADPPGGDFFNGATLGGLMPAGLALSQVHGLPTGDELWQHIDSEDGIDGGVTELARARSFGTTGYNRSATAEPYTFDMTYTANRVTVVVDGVLQLDATGDFEDGRFGLYTGWQGPTPVFANFEMFDAATSPLPGAFPEVTINRATGELTVENSGSTSAVFDRYTIASAAGSLNPSVWTTITDNYDDGSPTSVDSDAWGVDSSTAFDLAESEVGGADGASLAASQSISLGNVWTPSRFEDVTVNFEQSDGLIVPVFPNFIGNGDAPFERSDLNTDGQINEADWLLFFPHSLSEFDGMTPTQAALLGDLDGDFDNDVVDFGLFKTDYELAQGAGAFAAMAASVPEPSSGALLMLVGVVAFACRRRESSAMQSAHHARVKHSPSGRVGLSGPERITQFPPFSLLKLMLGRLPSPLVPRDPPEGRVKLDVCRDHCLISFLALVLLLPSAEPAYAQPFDFTEFTLERFPPTGGFALADWITTPETAQQQGNASSNVLYSPTNVLGKRIRGLLNPSTDDDIVGFVLGFQPGDASFGDDSADADYLLLDWKGIDQGFDFNDPDPPDPPFNNLTGTGPMPAGLALSRVTGLANSDELWQHQALEGNTLGGVQELSRGSTLGFTGYDRSGVEVEFDILYAPEQVVVLVDGVVEFFESGSFTEGRFGLYTGWQSGGPTFLDFEVLDGSTLDLSTFILRADVNRATGDIVVSNNTGNAVEFDFYQFGSGSGSLSPDWGGLADGEAGADASAGVSWVEAGGADAGSIAELFLQDAAGNTIGLSLGNGQSITLTSAYNTALNAEDLRFSYRFPDGSLNVGLVTYMGEPPAPVGGDCNGDGVVNAADLVCVATIEERDVVLASLNTLPGDLDGDGQVAFPDFLILSSNFGDVTKTAYSDGNVDLMNGVAFPDFLVLSSNFGKTPAANGTAAAVPEPSSLILLCAGGLLIGLARRRR